ncbi:MAG: DUF302 domain-containing protein [Deltaproteobacteria bacterium]|nr:DUF302 domain-containing protein [Deltaproteobacteria bacterium]
MPTPKHPSYGFTRDLPAVPYDAAVSRARDALKTEGFGVLTEIDVKATMKQKLDAEYRPYVILGACNPPLAHRALTAEPFVGLFLPCNVAVMAREDGGSTVSAIDPRAMLATMGDPGPDLRAVGDEVAEKLRRVIERV